MGLYNSWKEIASKERIQAEYDAFWGSYLEKETKNYEYILENHNEVVSGALKDVAEKFKMDTVTFAGFLDGINTSLVDSIELDKVDEETEIQLKLDFERLYFNMLEAKADWLYSLPQWEPVLSQEKRNEIRKDFNKSKMAVSSKVGRNDPCTCGSGKKYKKCCGV